MSFDTEVVFGGDITDLKSKLEDATSSFQTATTGMQDSIENLHSDMSSAIEGITSTFEKIGVAFLAVESILKGGAGFNEMVQKSNELNIEAEKVSNTLGITAQEAGVLADALGDNSATAEQYLGVSQRLNRQLKMNESAINDLGIKTRDTNGDFLSQQEVMSSALTYIESYKAGTDRTQASMAVFGGRVGDLSALLRTNHEDLKAVSEEQERLGTRITPESIAAMREYEKAVAQSHDVINAMEKVIGDALIPRLTELADWMVSVGPQAVEVMRMGTNLLITTFNSVGAAATSLWDIVSTSFASMGNSISAVFSPGAPPMTGMEFAGNVFKVFGEIIILLGTGFEQFVFVIKNGSAQIVAYLVAVGGAAQSFFNFDWTHIQSKWREGMAGVAAVVSEGVKELADINRRRDEAESKLLFGDAASQKQKTFNMPKPGTNTWDDVGGSDTGAEAPSQMPAYEKQLMQMKVMYMQEHDLRELSKEQERTYWEQVSAFASLSAKDREAVQQKLLSAELQSLQRQKHERDAMASDQIAVEEKISATRISNMQMTDNIMLAEGKITEEQFDADKTAYEEASFQNSLAALKRHLAQVDSTNVVTRAKLNGEIEVLEAQHSVKMNRLELDAANKSKAIWDQHFSSIKSAFDNSIKGMLAGTMTLENGLRGIFRAITMEFIQTMCIDQLTNWLSAEGRKLAISLGFGAEKKASDVTSSISAIATSKMTAAGTIPAEAATAAGGAAEAVAPIPIVGPELAAAAYASTFAMVMGGLGAASASQGFDIPSGVNPMTQLHQEEMVLPANLANKVRGMTDGGGSNVTLHVSAIDANGVKNFFTQNKDRIAATLRDAARSAFPVNPNAPIGMRR